MPSELGNRALFFDLVGTLIAFDESRQIPLEPGGRARVELMPNVAETLAPIRDHLIFVVTNQAGIARGRLTRETIEDAMAELDRQLGDILTAWEICPHDDADRCACRKPRGGMMRELAEAYGVDMAGSTMVGDQEIDELAARDAGVGRFVHARDFFGWK